MKGIKDKFPHLPEEISGLRDLAYNLWWSWHPEGRELFKLLNRQGWFLSNHNPVKMLNRMNEKELEAAAHRWLSARRSASGSRSRSSFGRP